VKRIAHNLYVIEGLRGANVYVLGSDAALTLVDAGMAGDVDKIVAQIEEGGYDPSQLESILVTHVHTDHIGGVPKLVRRLGVGVMAYREEVPYLEGKENLPTSSWLQRAMRWLGDLLPGEDRGIEVARDLQDGETLDLLGGLQVIHTPGHTPGSMSLYQAERGILFCGDLLFNGHPLTGRGGLRYAPRAFSVDPEEVKQSVRELAGLQVRILCTGHGEPIVRESRVDMEALLERMRA
jgi:glyoxylase-like metal-dependent hydrolase (beta-lactamase superfamily II)